MSADHQHAIGHTTANKRDKSSVDKSLAPAVQRATSILALLETAPQRRFSLSDIAEKLQLPKSSVLNICNELLSAEFLRRTQDGYQLGRRLVQLGSAYISSVDLVREFYEVCREVPDDLDAMIQLSVLDGDLNAVYLARQDCSSGLHLGLRAEIGRRVPANCTGSGKAMLSALSAADLDQRLGNLKSLPTLTEHSIKTPAALRKELDAIRKRGYAIDDEEVVAGVACVAAAAKTSHREGGIVSISITSEKSKMTSSRQRYLVDVLLRLINRIQSRL
jgi:DNA-binding IclR family transcriptional regulator